MVETLGGTLYGVGSVWYGVIHMERSAWSVGVTVSYCLVPDTVSERWNPLACVRSLGGTRYVVGPVWVEPSTWDGRPGRSARLVWTAWLVPVLGVLGCLGHSVQHPRSDCDIPRIDEGSCLRRYFECAQLGPGRG